jgi:hypothetical protein
VGGARVVGPNFYPCILQHSFQVVFHKMARLTVYPLLKTRCKISLLNVFRILRFSPQPLNGLNCATFQKKERTLLCEHDYLDRFPLVLKCPYKLKERKETLKLIVEFSVFWLRAISQYYLQVPKSLMQFLKALEKLDLLTYDSNRKELVD